MQAVIQHNPRGHDSCAQKEDINTFFQHSFITSVIHREHRLAFVSTTPHWPRTNSATCPHLFVTGHLHSKLLLTLVSTRTWEAFQRAVELWCRNLRLDVRSATVHGKTISHCLLETNIILFKSLPSCFGRWDHSFHFIDICYVLFVYVVIDWEQFLKSFEDSLVEWNVPYILGKLLDWGFQMQRTLSVKYLL